MSCITEILKIKGDREFLVLPGVAVEDGGNYKEYEYLVTFTDRGHRCGYVAIDQSHPFYSKNVGWDNSPDVHVHGGVTFFNKGTHIITCVLGKHSCEDLWIGFDAMHNGDGRDYELVKKVFCSNAESISSINYIEKIDRESPIMIYEGYHKTKEYMVNECKKLIDQLIEAKVAA